MPAAGGIGLHLRHARPEVSSGQIVIVHGASDHGGRLRPLMRFFASRGWATVLPDLRGHGLSGGPRVHVDRFEDYLDDLDRVVTATTDPRLPTVLLGISLGGLIVARRVETPAPPAAAALVCPLFGYGFDVPAPLLAAGRLIAGLRPRTKLSSAADSGGPRSGERRFVTAGWFAAVDRALEDVWRDKGPAACPMAVVQSQDDDVVDAAATSRWAARLGRRAVFHPLRDVGHDAFGGPGWRELAERLESRFNAVTSGDAAPVPRAA
ncbi:MAG: alpha/beta hydrolase [Planctomycetota bacterium]